MGLDLVPELLPNLSPAQQNQLEQLLQADGAYELTPEHRGISGRWVWRRRSRAESGGTIFLRGGYTYLDAVIQRSFANDDVDLLGPMPTV